MEKNSFKKIYLFSLKLTNISEACTRKNKWNPVFENYPTVPKIERDINLIFNKKYFINEIITSIRKSGKKLLEDVNLVDIYSDESLGKDKISYTFRLSYRDNTKTLKDSDINELNNISEACTRKNKWHPVFINYPTVPKIERDINLIFNKKYVINEIISSIKKYGKKLLEDVNLVDIYSDESLGKEKISYTFRLSYRDHDKTLKDSDVTDLNSDIISKIENKFSAKIR